MDKNIYCDLHAHEFWTQNVLSFFNNFVAVYSAYSSREKMTL